MIAEPPSDAGRVHNNITAESVAVGDNDVGAVGTPAGVTDSTKLETPTVTALIALTRKPYATPFVNPVAVYDVDVEFEFETIVVQVEPALSERSIRYPIIALPPSVDGAVQDSDAVVLPGVMANPVGADGAPAGVTTALAKDEPVPAALIAETRNRYGVPFTRPVTV